MDDYVEAQVHGGLPLGEGVTAVVVDPSFRGTPTGALLAELAPALEWHPRFVLGPDEFGPTAEVLQQLKYLWHILVLRGHPLALPR